MNAAGDDHVRLLERRSFALYPQAGDANTAQDVPYAATSSGSEFTLMPLTQPVVVCFHIGLCQMRDVAQE